MSKLMSSKISKFHHPQFYELKWKDFFDFWRLLWEIHFSADCMRKIINIKYEVRVF